VARRFDSAAGGCAADSANSHSRYRNASRSFATGQAAVRAGDLLAAQPSVERERVLFFYGGWGKVAAAGSTQYVIDHFHPSVLILRGVTDLVSPENAEAQGNLQLFRDNTVRVMRNLIGDLAKCLPCGANSSRGVQM
jgi:hypothetical protein